MGEARRKEMAGTNPKPLSKNQVDDILQHSFGFAAQVLAYVICEKCGWALGNPDGTHDCEFCGAIRRFMGYERASMLVKPS